MKALTQFLSRYSVDALRIMSGVSLLNIAKSFIQDTEFLSSFLWSGPLPFLTFILCHLIIATHLAGGIALILGFVTRIAAIAQMPFVIGALGMLLFSDAVPEQLWALNLAPLMFLSFLSLIVLGPGEVSVDRLIGLETESINTRSDNDSGECQVIMLSSNLAEEDEVELARRLAV